MARRKDKHFTQRGVALIAAIVAVGITSVLVKEFSTNTTVDWFAATNARNNMQAEFLTRSGANLSQLVLRVQRDFADKYAKQFGMGDLQITDYVNYFVGAFAGSKEEVRGVANMIGGIDVDNVKGLGVPFGNFDIVITPEDGKININCAGLGRDDRETMVAKLQALFWPKMYDEVFQNPDAEGWRRTREEQVAAIVDYVDKDNSKHNARGNPEDYGYQSLRDDYEAKNNYLDSTAEIHLIRGVDDRFWTLFGDNLTVYGDCKDHIGAVNDPRHIAAIIFLAAKDQENDRVVNDPAKLFALAQRVVQYRASGGYFDSVQAFADFVAKPNEAMQMLFGMGAAGADATEAAAADPMMQQPVEGVELDTAALQQVVDDGPRRIYRVEVTATIGPSGDPDLQRHLTAIWDQKHVNQNSRNPRDYGQGAWIYWRLE